MKNSVFIGFLTGLTILVYLNSGKKEDGKTPTEVQSRNSPESHLDLAPQVAPVEESNKEMGFAPASNSAENYSVELTNEIGKAKRALPMLSDLKSIPADEAHSTPARIIEAGAALGELEEYLEKKPEEFMAASRFFSDCASGTELPPSVRAMCLHSLRNNPTQWAPGVSAKLEALPSEVIDLEAQL